MKSVSLQPLVLIAVAAVMLGGCGAPAPKKTGFLSDYSNLERRSDTSFRFVAPGHRLAEYDSFIIEPVKVYHHGDVGSISASDVRDLATYFRGAIIGAISDRYRVTSSPGPGVARVRIALTDVQESTWWMNVMPTSKVTGAGTGSAAMEGEVLDSVSGEQLAALVESQRGNQFELDTFNAQDDAEDVMDGWARRFRQRLDEAHGR